MFKVVFLIVVFLAPCAEAADIAHLNNIKAMVSEVDHKSVAQWLADARKTKYPETNLKIKEAMARTYVDIVREQKVQGIKKKEWLYSKIALNMAYMQFGGSDADHGAGLDRLIRQKLKQHLPAGIVNETGFHFSLE